MLFGATGDLAGRFLLPAVAELKAAALVPEKLRVVASATEDWDEETFRRHAAERLDAHASAVPAGVRAELVRSLRYRQTDVTDAAAVAEVVRAAGSDDVPVVAYLALPPGAVAAAVTALGAAGLPAGSRVALEKPFGTDLDSAITLNALLRQQIPGESAVFRVDHVLGMATVQTLVGLRLANRPLEAVWNRDCIQQVDVLWEETLALEGRAAFYDRAGALQDVVQNHMLQLLSLVAMEPPGSLQEQDLRDSKVAALRAVRQLEPDDVPQRTRRGRYVAGPPAGLGGAADRDVPSYAEADGVDPDRGTETFAEVLLELDTPRWAGTRFRLRAGKALAARRRGVLLHLLPTAGGPFAGARSGTLWIGVDGPEDVTLALSGHAASVPPQPVPLTLTGELPAYSRVLLDVLGGGSTLSVRADEAEQAWRILAPVMQGWRDGRVPLVEYRAGSAGPPPLSLDSAQRG